LANDQYSSLKSNLRQVQMVSTRNDQKISVKKVSDVIL